MPQTFTPNIRLQGQLEIGIDEEQGAKWVARTIVHARNVLNIGMRDGPQTGREYLRASKIHTASKAGQWPAIDSGNLRINTRVKFSGFQGEIGSNVPYAEYLQRGTRKAAEGFIGPTRGGMGARRLYNEALQIAVDDMSDKLEGVIFVRFTEDEE